jgi:hypothetical protein
MTLACAVARWAHPDPSRYATDADPTLRIATASDRSLVWSAPASFSRAPGSPKGECRMKPAPMLFLMTYSPRSMR